MYIVNEDLPTRCWECPIKYNCNEWNNVLTQIKPNMSDKDILKMVQPMNGKYCKIIYNVPRWIEKLYVKWFMGECRHLCILCKHKEMCYEEWNYGK